MKAFISILYVCLSLIIILIYFTETNAPETYKLKEISFKPLNCFQYDLDNSETVNDVIRNLTKQTSVKFDLYIPKKLLDNRINIKDKKRFFKIIELLTNNLNASFSFVNLFEFNMTRENKVLNFRNFASDNFFVEYKCIPLTSDKSKTVFFVRLNTDWRVLKIIKASCNIIQNNKTYNIDNDFCSKDGLAYFTASLDDFDVNKEYDIKIKITAEKHTAIGLEFVPIEGKVFSGDHFTLKIGKRSDRGEYSFVPLTFSCAHIFSDAEWNLLKSGDYSNLSEEKLDALGAKIPTIMGLYYFEDDLPVSSVDSYSVSPPMFEPTIEFQLPYNLVNDCNIKIGIILFLKDGDNLVETISFNPTFKNRMSGSENKKVDNL